MASLQRVGPVLRLILDVADGRLRLTMVATTLLIILGGAMSAATPLALKHLVDAVAASAPAAGPAAPTTWLVEASIYMAALCGSRLVGDLRPLLTGAIDQQLIAGLRRRFFWHLLHLPLAGLLQRRSGEVLHSLDLAAAGAQLVVAHLCNSIMPVIVELAVMNWVLAGLQQPLLVALFGATALLYLAVFALGTMRLSQHAQAVTAASLAVHGQLADGLGNVETLRCFRAETQARQALETASSDLVRRWRGYHLATGFTALAATSVFALSMGACFAIAMDGVARGSLTVGGFVLSSVYLLQMVRPLEVLGSAARDLARALGFVRPLLDILREAPEDTRALPVSSSTPGAPAEMAPTSEARDTGPSIRFEALTFGYDPKRPVIHALDLEIAAGTTTAIVGPSGSGKSSLIRLLLRLYAPQRGRILLDNCPIDALSLDDLRSRFGLVPQDTALLHASIATNIALGVPEAARDGIVSAARGAQLHEVVESMPGGYDTLIGERGLKLSGGERQRLAIARALIRRPQVFLLDEPTSMLDSKTEAQVLLCLQQATAGRTTLIVAHRLSTVVQADEIIVLDRGRVHERGRHADLLASHGLYAQLWRQQMQRAP